MPLKRAIRSLVRDPWYVASIMAISVVAFTAAGLALALTAGILLRGLPYPDPSRLVAVSAGFRDDPPGHHHAVSIPDVSAWAAAIPEARFTAYSAYPGARIGRRSTEPAYGMALVQESFFDVIGTRPLIGGFTSDDFHEEQRVQPVIISYDLWQSRYQGAQSVLGVVEVFDLATGHGHRIAGVMPKGFVFPAFNIDVKLIRPFVVASAEDAALLRRALPFVVARLPDGVGIPSFRARIESAMAELAQGLPSRGIRPDEVSEKTWRDLGPFDRATVQPIGQFLKRPQRRLSGSLASAAGILFVVVGFTAAALSTARLMNREQDVRFRIALGASKWGAVEPVVWETVLCATVAMLCSSLLAVYLSRQLGELLPTNVVLFKSLGLDLQTKSGLVVLVPTYVAIASSIPVARVLALVRGEGQSVNKPRWAPGVMIAQIGVTLTVVIIGLLFLRSLWSVYSQDVAALPVEVAVFHVELQGPGSHARDGTVRVVRLEELLGRLAQMPRVRAVGVTGGFLLDRERSQAWSVIGEDGRWDVDLDVRAVTPGFFDVMRLRVVAGKLPAVDGGQNEVVVSESLARRAWQKGSALGQRLESPSGTFFEVVGVVEDVRWLAWDQEAPSVYGSYRLLGRGAAVSVVLRADGRIGEVVADALSLIDRSSPPVRVVRTESLDGLLRDSVRERRLYAWTFGGLAVGVLIVLGVGIAGTSAMLTIRRRREAAIRHAMGATRSIVVRELTSHHVRPLCIGLVVGIVSAAAIVNAADLRLHQLSEWDLWAWTGATVCVALIVVIAAVIPAMIVSRDSPAAALRGEQRANRLGA